MKKILIRIYAYTPITIITLLIVMILLLIISGKAFEINYVHIILTSLKSFYDNIIIPLGHKLDIYDKTLKHILYGLFFIISWYLIIKLIPKILGKVTLVILLFLKNILKFLMRLISGSFFKNDSTLLLITTYIKFLKGYVIKGDFKLITESHLMFFGNIFNNTFKVPDDENIIFKTLFEERYYIKNLNQILKKHIKGNIYIRKEFINLDGFFLFYVNKGDFTGNELKARITSIADELLLSVGGVDEFNILVTIENSDDICVKFIKKDLRINKKLDLKSLKIKKGEILLGFYPYISNKGIEYKNYFINISDLIHSFLVGTSRSGKDTFMLNFILSILMNIKEYRDTEIHFFDSKGSDGVYLDNLSSYGIFRYANVDKYPSILEEIEKEMDKRQAMVGIYSNFKNYNKENSKNIMKHKIIIINELLSLFTSYDKDNTTKLTSHLNNLLSKGAGVGIRIIFMA